MVASVLGDVLSEKTGNVFTFLWVGQERSPRKKQICYNVIDKFS